ncbi:MAG: YkgJ family cysteine cluster protein [Promethearchaeota archaeon]
MQIASIFKNGVYFSCVSPQDCDGRCCKGSGSIFIFPEDIRKIKAFLRVNLEEFLKKFVDVEDLPCEYTKNDGFIPFLVLKERENGTCVFLDGKGSCTIYPSRPFQCMGYPFWIQNVKSPSSWEKLLEFCPGAKRSHEKKSGIYYSAKKIKALIKKEMDLDKSWEIAMIKHDNNYKQYLTSLNL